MDLKMPQNAAKLLDLERRSQVESLSGDQLEEWQSLVSYVFKSPKAELKRRSFRIPSSSKALLSTGTQNFEIEVKELSLINLTLAGKNVEFVSNFPEIVLNSVYVNNQNVRIDIRLKLIATSINLQSGTFGAEICNDNSDDKKTFYFNNVYYPVYIGFLKKLAETEL